MKDLVASVRAWLATNAPGLADCFAAPVSETQLAEARETFGRPFPDDYLEFLRLHDGQRFDGGRLAPLLRHVELLPIGAAWSEYETMIEHLDSLTGIRAMGPVRPVYASHAWWPITCICGSSRYHCLDLDPAPGGRSGQIILVDMKDSVRRVIAPSFRAVFELIADTVRSPQAEIADDGISIEDDSIDWY